MRRVIYADSFIDDADRIAAEIEVSHGVRRADAFREELDWLCAVLASNPRIGKIGHGCDNTLYGLPHGANWIFFQFDDTRARFVRIMPARRNKSAIRF